MEFLKVFLAIFGFFVLAFIMINITWFVKKREFRGTCATNNPMIADRFGGTCSVCGKSADEACQMPEVEKGKA
ncbi:MAG: hypothetical protein AAFZ15_00155 [Bacteroidota bacterium]